MVKLQLCSISWSRWISQVSDKELFFPSLGWFIHLNRLLDSVDSLSPPALWVDLNDAFPKTQSEYIRVMMKVCFPQARPTYILKPVLDLLTLTRICIALIVLANFDITLKSKLFVFCP